MIILVAQLTSSGVAVRPRDPRFKIQDQ
jgi:hypothetical protein